MAVSEEVSNAGGRGSERVMELVAMGELNSTTRTEKQTASHFSRSLLTAQGNRVSCSL
jgi:hypothetical protein